MEVSLMGPDGYYSRGKVQIDPTKDFTTSSEKMLFAPTMVEVYSKVWEAMGKPETFDFIEMGAGNGSFAARFFSDAKERYPKFYAALHYTIVECGDLIEKQRQMLTTRGFSEKVRFMRGSVLDLSLENIEGGIFSNELPDTFPVECVKGIQGRAKQKHVGIMNGQWVEIWDTPDPDVQGYLDKYMIPVTEDQEIAVNLNAVSFQQSVARSLKRGASMIVDYTRERQMSDYVGVPAVRVYGMDGNGKRITRNSDITQMYQRPGCVDITSYINFSVLDQTASESGLTIMCSDPQSVFLQKAGIKRVGDHYGARVEHYSALYSSSFHVSLAAKDVSFSVVKSMPTMSMERFMNWVVTSQRRW